MHMEMEGHACLTFCRFRFKMGRVEREVDFAVLKTLGYVMALLYTEIWRGVGGLNAVGVFHPVSVGI